VLHRLMALFRKAPARDPELDRTRARIDAAAIKLGRKIGLSSEDIIRDYLTADAALHRDKP
jgi:HD-GYP domain-containing protein (c-di-GMP phosphodiesterase class II)